MRSDVDLTFKDEREPKRLDEAARLPGVDRAEPVLNVACTFINGPHRKKGAITGLAARRHADRPARLDGPTASAIPAHGLAMSRTLAEMLHLGSRRSGRRRADQGPAAPAVRARCRNRRQLPGHGRLRRHPLPQPLDRRGAGHQRRPTGHRPRPGPPRRPLPRTEADARPAGRHRAGRHDPEPRRHSCSTTSGSSSACWSFSPASSSSAAS